MKLQLKKAQVVYAPHWHPNFRNTVELPDLKVVRTTFFVNALFITVAAAALLFTIYREYVAFNLRSQIAYAEARVQAAGDENAKLLAMNREFSEAARKFVEAREFVTTPIVGSELLQNLSRTLPRYMDFSTIVWENSQLVLRGGVRGASEAATSRVTAYRDALLADAAIGGKFPEITITSVLRDPRTQGMTFEIVLKQSPEKAAPKGGKQP